MYMSVLALLVYIHSHYLSWHIKETDMHTFRRGFRAADERGCHASEREEDWIGRHLFSCEKRSKEMGLYGRPGLLSMITCKRANANMYGLA